MKNSKTAILLLFLTFTNISLMMAQETIAGLYHQRSSDPHGGSAIFVLPDHKFVVTFFGGVVVGNWEIEGDVVAFKPFVNEHQFYVYGRHNKDLGDSSRIYFQGFDRQETFIGFGTQQNGKPLLKRVFNDAPNCVPYPVVRKFKGNLAQLVLADQPDVVRAEMAQAMHNVYVFDNAAQFNDFVVYYIADDADKRPFYAKIKGNQLFFDQTQVSAKKPLPTDGEDFDFVQAFANAPQTINQVFYSPLYKQSDENVKADPQNWKFDAQKNAYINFLNYEEGEEYRTKDQSDYNRVVIVYQFDALPLANKKAELFAIDQEPLFVAKCN